MIRKRSFVPLQENKPGRNFRRYPIETSLRCYMRLKKDGTMNKFYWAELKSFKDAWDFNEGGYRDNILIYILGVDIQ